MKNIIKKINFLKVAEWALIIAMLIVPVWATVAQADIPTPNCGQLGGIRCTDTDLTGIILTVIRFALGLAFLIAVLMLIFGGFRYITSAGNEETAGKGKKTIINALIGIAIVILSYVIVSVVSRTVTNAGA